MTPDQKAAVSSCLRAFNIPEDCSGFRIVIRSDNSDIRYGFIPRVVPAISAHVDIALAPMPTCDVDTTSSAGAGDEA